MVDGVPEPLAIGVPIAKATGNPDVRRVPWGLRCRRRGTPGSGLAVTVELGTIPKSIVDMSTGATTPDRHGGVFGVGAIVARVGGTVHTRLDSHSEETNTK